MRITHQISIEQVFPDHELGRETAHQQSLLRVSISIGGAQETDQPGAAVIHGNVA